MKRVRYFFLILLARRAKLLTHDRSSGCLATVFFYREVVAKKHSVTMASRFEIVDKEYIEELKDKGEMKTRRKVRSTGRTL